jgi:hypothetical protein
MAFRVVSVVQDDVPSDGVVLGIYASHTANPTGRAVADPNLVDPRRSGSRSTAGGYPRRHHRRMIDRDVLAAKATTAEYRHVCAEIIERSKAADELERVLSGWAAQTGSSGTAVAS